MDIKISDKWLREYLTTSATPARIAECLALCGPSVEKVSRVGKDYVYDIEVTTNRVDCMGILGIAREANAILPQFRIKASLKKITVNRVKNVSQKNLLDVKIDTKLVNRVMAVVMEVGEGLTTPKWMKERLELSGMRSLNPLVDITNYVMLEIGHPTHVFDYYLLKGDSETVNLIFRESRENEEITAFDGKEYKLPGGDIVIENGKGGVVDLPGIIGLKNSVVNDETKRIVFFIDNIDPVKIRKTSTRLGIRTMAAVLNEKGVDTELAEVAFVKGVELYRKICKAKITSKIYDIYPRPYKTKIVKVEHAFIEKIIGVPVSSKQVLEILSKLGFETKYSKKDLVYLVNIPSWRTSDVQIPEDIVEEVARIYGYHNLPSKLMIGALPQPLVNNHFAFEDECKNVLKGYGGIEVYTSSLTSKDFVEGDALSLKNPLGDDSKYLRTSLKKSLISAVQENNGEKEPFYLFEVANVYIPKSGDLPDEKMTLGVIFSNFDYRHAKGILEAMFSELRVDKDLKIEAVANTNYLYFDIDMVELQGLSKDNPSYIPPSKYPSQIEDITVTFPTNTKIGEVISAMSHVEKISDVQLNGIYEDSYTFRIWYHNSTKTLTNKEVEKIRRRVVKLINEKFGGTIKE